MFPMRILVLSNYFPPDFRGGFEISAFLICNSLAKAGHQVTVLTRENPPADGDNDPNFTVNRVFKIKYKHEDAKKVNPRFRGWVAVNATFCNGQINIPILKKHLQTNHYDLAICFNLESVGASLATELKRQKIPVLWSIGDYWIFERLQVGLKGRLARLNRFWWSKKQVRDELAAPWKHVIFNCENVHKKFTEAGVEPENTYIVYRSCPPPEKLLPYDFEQREKVFLVASQIRHHKGIHVVIEAARQLSLDHNLSQDWVVQIYGGGDEEYVSELTKQIADANLQNRVELRGKVSQSEIAAKMGMSMAFIHSALWDEPFGRVTMEAMAYGCPLISADSGAVFEIPTDKCALIYDRFNPVALADKMRLVVENPTIAKQYIEAGLTRYDECFRPEIEAEKMQKVIAEVLVHEQSHAQH